MNISRVRVGQPLGRTRLKTSVSLRWAGARSQKEAAPRLRLSRAAAGRPTVPSAPAAPRAPDMVAPPLFFLSLRNFFILAGLALVVIMLIWGMVRSNHQAVAYSYEMPALNEKKLRLQEINRQLNAELTEISSLSQLEKAAPRLGLGIPQQGQIVVID